MDLRELFKIKNDFATVIIVNFKNFLMTLNTEGIFSKELVDNIINDENSVNFEAAKDKQIQLNDFLLRACRDGKFYINSKAAEAERDLFFTITEDYDIIVEEIASQKGTIYVRVEKR